MTPHGNRIQTKDVEKKAEQIYEHCTELFYRAKTLNIVGFINIG